MNWDAIGAIAELLGAIGVIASLVYLATQIRQSREQMSQNTQALRAGTYQQFRHEIYEALHGYMKVPGFSQTVLSGRADFHQLDDEEALVFRFWVAGLMGGYDNAYYQYRMGLLDEERWQTQRAAVVSFLASPGIAQLWRASQLNVSLEFVALVEEILGEEAEGADESQS
jgi:hypothetical protein